MGRSVSYASGSRVVTFRHFDQTVECDACEGKGHITSDDDDEMCDQCDGDGVEQVDDFDQIVEDFQSELQRLFPSVTTADAWIDREDHVLAENRLARFGISEYCGLVSYWIVPKENGCYSDEQIEPLANRWIDSIADKFIAAFGELSKVGSMSNGEGVYRQIRRD